MLEVLNGDVFIRVMGLLEENWIKVIVLGIGIVVMIIVMWCLVELYYVV